jgi:antibiotic biosynthesis monooxygenase (ABM) superfamily enzyme
MEHLMGEYNTKKLTASANLKDIVQWQMKRREDLEEEASHRPPVTIYLNLFNDINSINIRETFHLLHFSILIQKIVLVKMTQSSVIPALRSMSSLWQIKQQHP